LLIPVGDDLNLTFSEKETVLFEFDLMGFELGNVFDKWAYRAAGITPWSNVSKITKQKDFDKYIELSPFIREAEFALLEVLAQDSNNVSKISKTQVDLKKFFLQRDSVRNGAEEHLETAITKTLKEHRIGSTGKFVWPPVDIRIDNPPRLLIISPRTEIRRIETVLINPEITVEQIANIENKLLKNYDVSAIILKVGGLATYPSIIPSGRELLPMLEVSAHEWLHAHLFFYPLGQAFFEGGNMVTINETLANIVGDEIGGLTWSRLTGNPPPSRIQTNSMVSTLDHTSFNYAAFMKETRLEVEKLLEFGEIEKAEYWMEKRRNELLEHGYYFRKINQAFFAFYGDYADSPLAISPIANQLWALKTNIGSTGKLLKEMRQISSVKEFEVLLSKYDVPISK